MHVRYRRALAFLVAAAVAPVVIDLGVDGLISDDPELLVRVAIRNGLR